MSPMGFTCFSFFTTLPVTGADNHYSVVSETIFDMELVSFVAQTALFGADAFLMSTLLFFSFLLHCHDNTF